MAEETILFDAGHVHATPDEKGRWLIGCAFVVPHYSEEALQTYQLSAS
jgi:hypothetical protein